MQEPPWMSPQLTTRVYNNRKLLLASSFLCIMPELKKIRKKLQGKTAVFIATASYVESYGIANRLMIHRLKTLGMHWKMIDVGKEPQAQLVSAISKADLIYVCGGNTFYLMQQLKASGADRLIVEQVARGIPYVAESAGSVIAAHNISYIATMDSIDRAPNLTSMQGLGLIQYAIVPHVQSHMLGTSAQQIIEERSTSQTLLPLHNDQALIVDGHTMHIVTHHSILAALSETINRHN